MNNAEAGKLVLNDEIFIYDHGIDLIYSAQVIGIACPDIAKPKKPPELSIEITGWSEQMGARIYKPSEIHSDELSALRAKSDKLQFDSDKLMNEKFKTDQRIEALKEGA